MSAVINADDILRHDGDVEAALKEKRKEAAQTLRETKSLPSWWDPHLSLGGEYFRDGRGAPPKFTSVEEYYSLGYEYFERCAEEGRVPTKTGLFLHLGFANQSYFVNHLKRNPPFRECAAWLCSLLQIPLEQMILEPGGQAGRMFMLKNIPEGLMPEDPSDTPMQYAYKDRTTTELTGLNGGPIEVSRGEDPEVAYRKLLEGGKLEEKSDDE